MKILFPLSLVTFITVISAFAQTQTVVVMSAAEADRREAAQEAAQAKIEAEKAEHAWFSILAQKGLVPHDRAVRGRYYDWLKSNRQWNEFAKELTKADPASIEGDPIPLSTDYDDEGTIKIYLRDSGYTDLSDAQIAQVRLYMHQKGIRDVSKLGL